MILLGSSKLKDWILGNRLKVGFYFTRFGTLNLQLWFSLVPFDKFSCRLLRVCTGSTICSRWVYLCGSLLGGLIGRLYLKWGVMGWSRQEIGLGYWLDRWDWPPLFRTQSGWGRLGVTYGMWIDLFYFTPDSRFWLFNSGFDSFTMFSYLTSERATLSMWGYAGRE